MANAIVTQIEQAFAEAIPTCVLSVYTPEYGEGGAALRAGVRGYDDWLMELEACTLQEAYQLMEKYGAGNIHYLVDDSSTTQAEFESACAAYTAPAPAPQAKQVLVATHPEAGVIGVFASQAAWERHCAVTGATDLEEYATEWLVVEG